MTYLPDRNYSCRMITDGTLKGLRTVVLENQKLRVTPAAEQIANYHRSYSLYQRLYPVLKPSFDDMES